MTEGHRITTGELVPDTGVRRYFHEALMGALDNQRVDAAEAVAQYLRRVLEAFVYPNPKLQALLEEPLALQLAAANNAPHHLRLSLLQQLGDVALFVSGFFSDSFSRKAVGVGYYIDMGEYAYARVANSFMLREDGQIWVGIFTELHQRFDIFVDVLAEVSEHAAMTTDQGIVKLYERWLRTGNEQLARRLTRRGVIPQRLTLRDS